MLVNLNRDLEKKEIRTLNCLWKMLCNKKRYFLPKTIDEYKDLFNANNFPTKIKIDNIDYYFTGKHYKEFRDFIDKIFYHSTTNKYFCYNTIYKTVLHELEKHININSKNITDDYLIDISNSLNNKLNKREFYFIISGLKLKEIDCLLLNDMFIFNFEEQHLNIIMRNSVISSKDDDFNKHTHEFVKKNFFSEICIKIPCLGDCETAEKTARYKAKLVLNYFRFLFCILHYERVHENLIQISIKSEVFHQEELFFYQSEPDGNVSFSRGKGRSSLQDFEIDKQFLRECKENIYFNDFFDFAFKNDKTEIEKIITTAIYWIGEAQADFDKESSFLKYWIAIESIFTSKKNEITENLCKGISVILAFTPYGFIEPNNIREIHNRVSKLYDLRGKIVHQGSYQEIKDTDLVEMCKLSWQLTLSFFHLRSINYKTIAEVEEQTNRLFEHKNNSI